MNLLAIDTATESCSVALHLEGMFLQRQEIQPTGHSKLVLQMVDVLLAESSTLLSSLDAIAVDTGPGSFTGVRIGLGVAQGLAYAADLPVLGINSLEILAASSMASHVLATIDARMNQVYCALYQQTEGLNNAICPLEIFQPMVSDPDQIPFEIPEQVHVIGSGWDTYKKVIRDSCNSEFSATCDAFPEAQTLAKIACCKAQSDLIKPMQLQAQYIRNNIVN